jgi:hypothetical protein
VNDAMGLATVDLIVVLREDEFSILSRNPDVAFVLNRLVLGADGRLGLDVRSFGVQ